ncbi:TetR/AcrR family transcriptional regulator [Microbacterium sp. zg.Y625]|uniref:TetR/AcrR family transcriptional regulator n=1 Tax=Microbacterium jiangjiandongii TaxID=3049071 RepID=UPI00214AD114|nr:MULTISPECIES: TetR/AcrR family transcriptional regulator [unclassified Microbacterium]MCR2792572.1 TetR/AcrR family transcriptional regulator [Microbacterium sp. zg.Y625]MCR2814742.1 TetR/AcrR family transcriptional regulator [Microbacterium sp. zg.Y843]WIM26561.1 TetR/AcrR family transcriptional regulator [Microbacterium sp. zg-Y625]
MTTGPTDRERAKADRHASLLREASRLFAQRGFAGVSLEDLGTAVGITGPAVYRHFPNKQALLGAILVDVSRTLRDGGGAVVAAGRTSHDTLDALIAFHVDFALTSADVIRVHDRELASLSEADRRTVRRLQREYVELWVVVLDGLRHTIPAAALRVRAHACFGLINSTPHSLQAARDSIGDAELRDILRAMARASLMA